MSKIGIGYITYKRKDNWKKLKIDKSWASEFVVVNDGGPYPEGTYPDYFHVIQHPKNQSVGISKNDALKYLISKGCTELFIIEDDIIIKDPSCFQSYINLAEKSGIQHLNYGYHGPANIKDGKPNPRVCLEYDDVNKMALNLHCVGAFSYYHKSIIDKVGFIDEFFINCWEHVEHTYRIIKAGLHPAFWLFSDVMNSNRFFDEIGTVANNSVIRQDKDFREQMLLGRKYFQAKHGVDILSIPDANRSDVMEYLNRMEKK